MTGDGGKSDAPQGTQAVLRVTRILKSFTPERPEWRLTPLAAHLGLAKSTTHRLLGALESEGFVRHDLERRVYSLGGASVALGLQALRGHDVRTLAQPVIRELARISGETATLEMLADGEMVIVAEVAGDHVVNASGWVGTRWPLHATSSGKTMLAHLAPGRRDELLTTPLIAFTGSTITDRASLETEIARAATRGYATARDELELGYSAVSSAVLSGEGAPLAALSIGGPSSRLDVYELDRLGELVMRSAADLSDRLRLDPGGAG